MSKKLIYLPIIVLIAILVLITSGCKVGKNKELNLYTSRAILTKETKTCIECHTKKQPSLIKSWQKSAHAESGVGCYECHGANESDPDAFEHFGFTVAVIVSPNDCSRCHSTEAAQFLASHHAKAGEVLGSLDNYLGEVVEGISASVSGCQQCHGSKVEVDEKGHLKAETWPNFGIGRINPDGSSGACSACHSRHDFTLAQARSPETCGKCHMGPDHPQKEVFEESKHGIAYRTHIEEMNLDSPTWVVGRDYSAAPTCATCHAGATENQSRTHDPGTRLSWNIRAPISFKTENSKQKRLAMKDVCLTCHNPNYVDNFYKQYDSGVELYNEKFAKPAKLIMDRLKKAGKVDPTPFNEKIEWTYFELWHHEGRRARNGLAMLGPDYTQWHGFYDIAEKFYIELVKEAEELLPGVTKDILARTEHKWLEGKMTAEERKKVIDYYSKRYGDKGED